MENQDEIELLNIDDDVWWISDGVLEDCRLCDEEVRIPDGVIEIGDYPFDSYEIERIYLPRSVAKIGNCSFQICSGVQEIHIANKDIILQNECFCELENLKSVYIGGRKVEVVVTYGSYGPKGGQGNCVEKYVGESEVYTVDSDIKKLGKASFSNNIALKQVSIPQSVVEIDDRAFLGYGSLERVELPDTLEIIGWRAFEGCCAISELKIPQSVYHIGERAFDGWGSNQTIYAPILFKKLKIFQGWRKACKATVIYY